MHGRRAALLLLPLTALLFAGCTGPVGPPVSARTVPVDAPSEGGSGSYTLVLRVTDEPGGPPLARAGIIVYWGDLSEGAEGGAEARAEPGTASVAVRASVQPSTPEPDETVPVRTDASGLARVHAAANRVVGIVGAADGHTEEWAPAAVTGDPGGTGTLDFPLYRVQVAYDVEDSWAPAGASPGRITQSNYMWKPAEVAWGSTPAARAGYVERLESMRVVLGWTNGPTGGGDLAIGVGATSGDPDHVGDADTPQAGPGEQQEEDLIDLDVIEGKNDWPSSDTLYAGPATRTAFVAPLGLPYVMHVEATFNPFTGHDDAYDTEGSPLPALQAVVAAAAAAVLARRLTR